MSDGCPCSGMAVIHKDRHGKRYFTCLNCKREITVDGPIEWARREIDQWPEWLKENAKAIMPKAEL